ncbi:MAG: flagellar biosynthesis protein FlhB, partial [Clostridiales bacterium]|nr:flagellar biosynthesis protein FlhB [Clostridiales bacterium]
QWFAKDGPGGEKTEPATDKKLREAREEGKVAKSKELTAAFDLIVLFLALKIFVGMVGNGFLEIFSYTYRLIPDFLSINAMGVSGQAVRSFLLAILAKMLIIVAPFFLFGVVVCLVISIIQVGWKLSTKPMQPKLDRFNPISGFKRIFSKDSIFELFKSILKIAVIVYVAYSSIKDKANYIFILYDMPLNQAVSLCGEIIIDTGFKISLVYLVVGLSDFAYQKFRFTQDMKMTKQEVKDEYKNTEGNPEIKGRQRQRMREASRRRMMQDVPKADVVITNPTHLAVAIKYEPEVQKAPIVLAKGEDYLALKIREKAKENDIKIVENKPLARMLYTNVEIGQEIPPELYQAVAEILAMIYNTRN